MCFFGDALDALARLGPRGFLFVSRGALALVREGPDAGSEKASITRNSFFAAAETGYRWVSAC